MASGFSKAITALATLEEKLRRALGLAGAIGTTFEPTLRPVIVQTDLREPGNSFYRGRHFALANFFNVAAPNVAYSVRFDEAVIVLGGYYICGAAAVTNNVWLTSPDQAPAVAVANNGGVWIDRKTQATDLVPITVSAASAPITGTAPLITNMIAGVIAAGDGIPARLMPMMIPPGGALNFRWGAAANVGFYLWGRIAESRD